MPADIAVPSVKPASPTIRLRPTARPTTIANRDKAKRAFEDAYYALLDSKRELIVAQSLSERQTAIRTFTEGLVSEFN